MQLVIFITALLLLVSGVALSFLDQVSAATVTYGAAILTLVFAFLSEFKTFKGLGIEAELLDRKIEEADNLIARLKGISIPMAEMLLSSTARQGRIGTIMPRKQKMELLEKIESELEKCGVSGDQLEEAKVDWHYYNIFDLSSPIFGKINDKLNHYRNKIQGELSQFGSTPITSERRQEHEKLCERNRYIHDEIVKIKDIRQNREQLKLPKLIEDFIHESGVFTEKDKIDLILAIKEELDDVKYYIKHKEIRRLELWLNEDDE